MMIIIIMVMPLLAVRCNAEGGEGESPSNLTFPVSRGLILPAVCQSAMPCHHRTLDLARAKTGIDRVRVVHRPRLLSDNGPCYVSGELADYLETHKIAHTRGHRITR